MENTFTFRNRTFSSADVALVRQMIAEHPEEGRCALSRRLCLAWNWTQPNGQPKDMICRGLLLELERKGAIRLPPMKKIPFKNPFLHRSPPERIEIDQSPYREAFAGAFSHLDSPGAKKPFGETVQQPHRGAPLPGIYPASGRAPQVHGFFRGPAGGMCCLLLCPMAPGAARSFHWVDSSTQGKESPFTCLQHPLFDTALGPGPASCIASFGPMLETAFQRLANALFSSGPLD